MELLEMIKKIETEGLVQAILSNTRDHEFGEKIKIRPIKLKNEMKYQAARYTKTQVFHENLTVEELLNKLNDWQTNQFKQGEYTTEETNFIVLVSQKGKMTIKGKKLKPEEKKKTVTEESLSHNREKQYILKEGKPVEFLVGLGVQSSDGMIAKNRYDKFRQINRYLEYIEDVLDTLPKDRPIRIIDFGCGKSYLTFALYYYLKVLQNRDLEVLGLDLKKDVIEHCNKLAKECGYDNLHFVVGDISSFNGWDSVDMVVSLHACDTATDYALEKAVKWGAKVIMAVPCCQHELNKQMKCDALEPVFKYGIIKERMAALITDAVRANLLNEQGYETQILEFIDMEHTPKNLLIRAVKREDAHKKMKKPGRGIEEERGRLQEMMQMLQIDPTLERILK